MRTKKLQEQRVHYIRCSRVPDFGGNNFELSIKRKQSMVKNIASENGRRLSPIVTH